MNRSFQFLLVFVGMFALVVGIGTFILSLAWGWMVPDVFSGAVANGNLPASLTLMQAFKLMVFLWLSGLAASSSGSSKS